MSKTESIGIPTCRHADRFEGRSTQDLNVKSMGRDIVLQSHFYILNSLSVFKPYIVAYEKVKNKKYHRMNAKLLLTRHNKEFIRWFNMRIFNDDCTSETIK